MSLRLIIEDDEGATTIVPLEAGAVTIGRQEGNTIQLTERNVSRRHARLAPAPEGWVIEDLNSYNGIRVNGIAIEGKIMLREGDVAQIGDYHLALCEDVDKKTLNLDRPVKAANDDEPLLVSSSSGLPRLSSVEVAELQRNYIAEAAQSASAPASAPRMTYPATGRASASRPGRLGVVVAAGAGVALVGLAIAFLLVRGKTSSEPAPQALAPAPVATPSPAVPVAPAQPIEVQPTPAEVDSATQAGAADVDLGVESTDVAAEEPAGEEEGQEPAPVASSSRSSKSKSPGSRSTRSKRARGSTSPPPPPPPSPQQPPAPAADPDQLLKDARVASLKGSHNVAYDLARRAYEARRNPAALKVMGVAACKMGDAGKAKAAYRKLSGANKEGLAKVCDGQGIRLD